MRSAEPLVPGRAIAIVGMAGRFPGARDLRQFWENLESGRESITFFTPAQLAEAGVSEGPGAGGNSIAARGVLDGAEAFDHEFFGFTEREALVTDPQLRLLLETAWAALEDAGYRPDAQPATGIFLGARPNGYADLISVRTQGPGDSLVATMGTEPSFFATRVSYKLGFKGPSLTVQTACSSSLVAVHLACSALRNRECDLALAGGVCIHAQRVGTYQHFEGSIMSADGHCRPFDASATGTVGGEGVVAVVLRRLDDAVADGDDIYAIIRGSSINNDGYDKIGYTAPSVSGQADVIRAALRDAGVPPFSVDVVETHGTGTALGDPVELEGLSQVFGEHRDTPLAIGSVKANIGHLDSASGVTSLVKTVLALRAGVVPPLVNFRGLTPHAPADSRFSTPTRALPWPQTSHPRRAGVSSFGMGGTNAHVVLEEAGVRSRSATHTGPTVLAVSARTESDLAALTQRLDSWLDTHPGVPLADVARTLQAGRKSFACRRAVIATRSDGAAGTKPQRSQAFAGDSSCLRAVMAFSGQGTQRPGAATIMYGREPVFASALDVLLDVLDEQVRCFLLAPEGDDRRPRLAQPAVFAEQYALAQLLREWGVEPAGATGNSIGEYAGACLAGVFAPRDAAELIAIRGELCERLCPPGAMLAVGTGAHQVSARLTPQTWVAVDASARRCTVSGSVEGIERLRSVLADAKIACQPLPVDRAYHTPLMLPMAEPFAQEVKRRIAGCCTLPLVSSVTGQWLDEADATNPAYWAFTHLLEPVRPGAALETLAAGGPVVLNVGQYDGHLCHPRTSSRAFEVVPVMPAAPGGDPVTAILSACARLWVNGVDIQWEKINRGAGTRRVHLPTYPFAGRRHWPAPAQPAATAVPAVSPAGPASEGTAPVPLDEIADVVSMIFDEVLGTSGLDPAASFFELGGDSLTATQVVARIRDTYPVGISLREFFDDPSISALSRRIEDLHMEAGA